MAKRVYDDMDKRVGMARFAPLQEAAGPMFSARGRARREGEAGLEPAVAETELVRSPGR